jgi:MSHA biogenesis protein MshN
MSVLNKMLRDLEQRQPDAGYRAESGIAAPARSRWPFWLLAVTLLLLSVLLFLHRNSTSAMLIAAEAPASISLPAVAMPTQPVIAGQNSNTAADTEPPFITSIKQTETEPVAASAISQAAAIAEVIKTNEPAIVAKEIEINEPAAVVAETLSHTVPVQVERTAPTLTQQQDTLQQQAIAATQAGQLQQALSLWQQVQQLKPQAVDAYLAQAGLWMQLAQPVQAEQVLLLGVQHGIVSAELQLLLAQHVAARADWQQVDTLLAPQFNLAQHPEYYGLKATALQQLGQQQAALHWFSQLIVLQPQQARWWLGAAIAYDAQAQHAQAQRHFRQALQWGNSLSAASRNYIQQRLGATE